MIFVFAAWYGAGVDDLDLRLALLVLLVRNSFRFIKSLRLAASSCSFCSDDRVLFA